MALLEEVKVEVGAALLEVVSLEVNSRGLEL